MHEKNTHSVNPKPPIERLIFVIVLIGSIGLWYMILYSPISENGDTYSIDLDNSSYANVSKIELNYNANIASVDIHINDQVESGVFFTSTWLHTWVAWDEDVHPIEIYFSEALSDDNTTLIITVEDNHDSGYNFFDNSLINEFSFDIYVNPDYIIDLNAETSSAPIDIFANNMQFDSIIMNQEYSSLDLIFSSVNVTNNITLTGSSGFVDLEFEQVNIAGDLSVTREYASIDLDFVDFNVGNMSFNSGSGYIEVDGTNLFSESLYTEQESASTRLNLDVVSVSDRFELISDSGYADVYLESAAIPCDLIISRATSSISFELDETTLGNVNLTSNSGYIDIEAHDVTFQSLYTEQTSASTSLNLENVTIHHGFELMGESGYVDVSIWNSVIEGNMNIVRTSASISLDLESIAFMKDVNVTATTTSGSIDLDWNQHFDALGANITVDLQTSSGSIDVDLTIPSSLIRFDVMGTTDTGNIDFDSVIDFSVLSESHYQSTNYPNLDLDLITIFTETEYSSIDYNIYENLAD